MCKTCLIYYDVSRRYACTAPWNLIVFCPSWSRFDPFAGPLSELEKWKRRQKLLTSVTDQLKSKECKGVIAILITAKSKVLKRWKAIDARYHICIHVWYMREGECCTSHVHCRKKKRGEGGANVEIKELTWLYILRFSSTQYYWCLQWNKG